MIFKLNDRVQVFDRNYPTARIAVGKVISVVSGVTVEWPETVPGKGYRTCTGWFGVRGGGNEDYVIKPYTTAVLAEDERKAKLDAACREIDGMLDSIRRNVRGYSEKELFALRGALKMFRKGG